MTFRDRITGLAVPVLALVLAGCGTSPLIEGNSAFRSGDYATAEARWTALAETGDVDAQHNLGVLALHRDDPAEAASRWRSAAAQEFVPSLLALARLELANDRPAQAVAFYQRAARWGSSEAIEALQRLDAPVPHADLWLASARRFEERQRLAARQLERRDPNAFLNRVLDEQAAIARND